MCCWIYLFYTLFYDNRPHTHCNKSRLHGHIVIHPDNVHSLPNTRLRICCSDILQRKYPTFITLSDVNLIYTNLFLLIYEPMLFELFQIHNKKINALFCFGNQQCPGFQISFNLVILYHIEKNDRLHTTNLLYRYFQHTLLTPINYLILIVKIDQHLFKHTLYFS